MAYGFGTTFGAASTDRAVTTLTAHATLRTYAILTYRNGDGGGSLGRMFEKRVAGVTSEALYTNSTTYEYDRVWNGSLVQWSFARPASGDWHHVGVTYDSGSTANAPLCYVDGSVLSTSRAGTPSGSLTNNTDAYVIGNRANDNARGWDGILAEFGIWDRLLPAVELALLALGVSPLFYPQSLRAYFRLVRPATDEFNAAPTVTGTAVRDHPRVLYPRHGRVWQPAAAAAQIVTAANRGWFRVPGIPTRWR